MNQENKTKRESKSSSDLKIRLQDDMRMKAEAEAEELGMTLNKVIVMFAAMGFREHMARKHQAAAAAVQPPAPAASSAPNQRSAPAPKKPDNHIRYEADLEFPISLADLTLAFSVTLDDVFDAGVEAEEVQKSSRDGNWITVLALRETIAHLKVYDREETAESIETWLNHALKTAT